MKLPNLFLIALCVFSIQLSAQKKESKAESKSQISLKEMIQKKSSDYVITSEHTDQRNGIHHIYLRQAINGLEVYGTESDIHLDKNGKLISSHNNFLHDIQSTVKSNSVGLNSSQAISSVANQMGYKISNLQQLKNEGGINQKAVYNKGGVSTEDIPVKLMYYYNPEFGTVKVWQLSIAEIDSDDWWNFRIDALSGNIIDKNNFTHYCNILDNHDHNNDSYINNEPFIGPINKIAKINNATLVGGYRVFAMPVESPDHGSRTLELDPDNAIASPFGWHDTNGVAGAEFTYTRGNNVYASEDRDGDNAPGFSPDGGPTLTFDFTLDLTQDPIVNESANITNLFYWNNIIHDVLYQYGFDEASGNFQENNYGNGGIGSDSVNADAQNPGNCNANFGTPSDGGNPRMQMFVCSNSSPSHDGDLDNMVIVHEYGHGISNRLTGGAGASGCLGNQEQMGEGWSDYYGLMLTMEPSDANITPRGVGTYLFGQPTNGPGIRPHPYSTDFAINPHTYDDIKTEVAPHGVGSVWAMILWEMTWEIMATEGFDSDLYNGTSGNNIAINLVTEGLKLQPCSPGFVDGRDAILAADQALYGGAYQCQIWDAFARRGLGFSADQGSTGSKSDGTEAFDLPPTFSNFDTQDEVCLGDGIQNGLTGGTPTGGVYSGTGVTNNGNGTTYTFDPSIPGAGLTTVTYTVNDFCTGAPTALTDDINVTDDPPVIICKGSGTLPMNGDISISPGTLITDNNTITSIINVTDNIVITDLDIDLNINHTWVSDMVITLQSPAGTTITILDPPNCSGDDVIILLDDEAPTSSTTCGGTGSSAAYPDPSYQPFSPLSAFDGENIMGDWTLSISDNASGDTGILNSWGLFYSYEIISPPLDVTLDGGGNATVNAADLLESVTVACGTYTVTAGAPAGPTVSFTTADIGTNNVDVIVTSGTGQISTCTAVVNVIAGGPSSLTITCPPDVTALECGDDTSPANTGSAIAVSSCDPNPTVTFSDSLTAGCGNTEVITRTWTATDTCGSPTAICVQTITVVDTTDPIATCPGNVTVNNDIGVCGAIVTYTGPTGTDTCGTVTVTQTAGFASGDLFPLGTTINTFTITDECGVNSVTCSFEVTVNDTENPVITCPADITQGNDPGNCEAIVTYTTPVGTDNCPGAVTVQTAGLASGDIYPIGTTTNTFMVTDVAGNTLSCSFDVTIEDTEAPILACPGDVTAFTENGECGAIVNFQNAVATDCGSVVVFQSGGLGSGSVFPIGETLIEFTAQDDNNNSSTCTFTVTVEDDDAPEAICQNITVQLDEFGDATITADQVNFGSSDNCGVDTLSIDIDTFDCSNVGENTVNLTVTDVNGNASTCASIVTIEDVTAPEITCNDITVELDAAGSVTIDPMDIAAGSSDACGIATYELNVDTFDCLDVGEVTVILTVTDVNGNQSSCSATVTVEDNINPNLVCMDVTIELGEDGITYISPFDLVETLEDPCGVLVFTSDVTEVTCDDIGTPLTVNVFATDDNGNTSTCSSTVTVVDTLEPQMVCPPNETVNLEPNGTYTLGDYIGDGIATATDNCTNPVTIFSQDPAAGTLLGFGVHVITFTSEDEYGNVSTCSFELEIEEILGANDSEDFASLVLYPNPADNKVHLNNPRHIDLNNITIYDLTGRIVNIVDLTNMGSEMTIDVSNLANAAYLIVIKGSQGTSNKQLIVNNN